MAWEARNQFRSAFINHEVGLLTFFGLAAFFLGDAFFLDLAAAAGLAAAGAAAGLPRPRFAAGASSPLPSSFTSRFAGSAFALGAAAAPFGGRPPEI